MRAGAFPSAGMGASIAHAHLGGRGMTLTINILIFLHFMAVAMGVGGGMTMSQVGPRLVAAEDEGRALLWPVADAITRIALIGLVLLLLTGPAILWLKFGGAHGMTAWFWAKMAFVGVLIVAIGVTEAAKAHLKRGDERAGRVMSAAGPVIGVITVGLMLCAVFAFN